MGLAELTYSIIPQKKHLETQIRLNEYSVGETGRRFKLLERADCFVVACNSKDVDFSGMSSIPFRVDERTRCQLSSNLGNLG